MSHDDNPNEIYVPSVDVCAWCSDSECDGIGCIASIDPNDPADHDALDQLHATIRAGKVLLQANQILDRADGVQPRGTRPPPDAEDGRRPAGGIVMHVSQPPPQVVYVPIEGRRHA